MSITYRGSGTWGAGKGAPLTIAELDENFHYHDQRIQNLIDNPPAPNNILSFALSGNQLTVTMEDGGVFGPYEFPTTPYAPPPMGFQSGATLTLTLALANTFTECSNATGCAITIPTNATVAFPVGTEISFVQAAAGPVSIVAASGVTLNKRADRLAATDTAGAVLMIKKTATDTWRLFGDLAVAP